MPIDIDPPLLRPESLAPLEGLDLRSLGVLQRLLLVSDGTLTDLLEAAFLEPIGLRKISLSTHPATSRVDSLDLDTGQLVMDRRILLIGLTSGARYIYAESLVAVDRLPAALRHELVASNAPIGRLWSAHKLETRKELLDVRRSAPPPCAHYLPPHTSDELVTRQYRLFHAGRPLVVITECFPARYPCGPD